MNIGGIETTPAALITVTPVAVASAVIAQPNPRRIAFIIYNNSANSVYISYGATAVSAQCTRIIATYTQVEVNATVCYTGVLSAIRNTGTGNVIVTELVR